MQKDNLPKNCQLFPNESEVLSLRLHLALVFPPLGNKALYHQGPTEERMIHDDSLAFGCIKKWRLNDGFHFVLIMFSLKHISKKLSVFWASYKY